MGMSTQNMSGGGTGLSFSKRGKTLDEAVPLPARKNNVFTDKEREELKEIFHEVLAEYGLVQLKD